MSELFTKEPVAHEKFEIGDIVRALVSTNPEDPQAIRKGNLYEVSTYPRHVNSGVIFITDKEAGNMLREYSSTYFELVVAKESLK